MNKFRLTLTSLTIAIFVSCSTKSTKPIQDIVDKFNDNGQTADSLRNAYQCENITLDKWEATGVTDSTFSLCLINAKRLPNVDPDTQVKTFKDMARSIKAKLKNPDHYNSIQIVFVESKDVNKVVGPVQSHKLGGVLSYNEL